MSTNYTISTQSAPPQPLAPQSAWYFSPLAFLTAATVFGVLIVNAIIAGGYDSNVDQGRTQRTAQITLALLTVSVCLYLLWYRGGIYKRLWRAFWTFSYLAYLTHLYFAIFGMLHGDLPAVFTHKELITHPVFDTLLTIWWGIDVISAWAGNPETQDTLIKWGRTLAHLLFPIAFFFATHEMNKVTPIAPVLGDLAIVIIAGCFIFWACVRRPVTPHN